ncbi:D-alanyl-D-alanine carboxypeptidase/D-alanyl-D-alanine endopeptidase [Brevibacillus ginsengisoli]|uniref:D-alanyl-D-alanine carboxypeptidase/D-alanyl-D-alanine endopeptidase n=1 Tax=Brevibacillus ginsengisoli TaxID=363854 RepID=UPI003CF9E4F8
MRKTKSRWWKLILMCSLSIQLMLVPAYAEAASAPAAIEPLAHNVEKLLLDLTKDVNSMGMQPAISVYDVTKQEVLYQHNAQKSLIPASNMKLFTTVAALEKLGPEYQFKTEVYLDGTPLPNGKVKGDLILKGYGDPSLSVEDLQKMAKELKDQGIERIDGRILVDESYFDSVRLGYGWMWDDEPFGYSAQLSALALHKNNLTLTITPDHAVSEAPTVSIEPQTSYVQIVNQVKIVDGEESDITVTRSRAHNVVTLSGTIGKQAEPYQEDVTMEDPAMFVAKEWAKQLEAAGITLGKHDGPGKTTLQTGTPMVTHLSKPLQDILVELNKESDNFYAETLLKTLGATQKGVGTAQAGTQVVAEVLKEAGVEAGFQQVDGSGLSRLDLITADQMVKLLVFADGRDYRDLFEKTLPIAGVDGTLKTRMKGTPAENKLIAKTGSMGGVYCLSGYVNARNNDKLAFSILINGVYKSKYARELQDKIGVILATYPEIADMDYQAPVKPTYKLSALLDPILEQKQATGLTAGVIVKALDGKPEDSVWYEHEADQLLTPASNLKLLTAASALKQLGEDYRFKTELYASEAIPGNGVLKGNLYLKGYGDPTLHTEDRLKVQDGVSIEGIVKWLKDRGVKKVNGDLILDESFFDRERLGLGWAWDDESYYFNPLLGGLALNRGTVMVEYQPGNKAGEPVKLALLPKTQYVKVINEAHTVEAGQENTLAIERERATNVIHVKGNLPLGTQGDYERVPVEEPALYVGTVLKEKLFEAGIVMNPKSRIVIGEVPQTAVKLQEFTSVPLRELVSYMLKKSDNFYAEMLLKTLGASSKQPGTSTAGVESVMKTIQAFGVATNFDMVDGSGLTRYNQISTRHIASVLEGMSKEPTFQTYYDSLPIAGVDGTLKSRLKGTPAEKNAHAKTGSMTGVNSLSGYVTTRSGEKLVFSIILNGYTENDDVLTAIQDQIVTVLASYQQP